MCTQLLPMQSVRSVSAFAAHGADMATPAAKAAAAIVLVGTISRIFMALLLSKKPSHPWMVRFTGRYGLAPVSKCLNVRLAVRVSRPVRIAMAGELVAMELVGLAVLLAHVSVRIAHMHKCRSRGRRFVLESDVAQGQHADEALVVIDDRQAPNPQIRHRIGCLFDVFVLQTI